MYRYRYRYRYTWLCLNIWAVILWTLPDYPHYPRRWLCCYFCRCYMYISFLGHGITPAFYDWLLYLYQFIQASVLVCPSGLCVSKYVEYLSFLIGIFRTASFSSVKRRQICVISHKKPRPCFFPKAVSEFILEDRFGRYVDWFDIVSIVLGLLYAARCYTSNVIIQRMNPHTNWHIL